MRVLFICKHNQIYNFVTYCRRSSGLYNSTQFIVESLVERGVFAEIVEIKDNNDIDREVSRFKPDIVVIEALWVVPDKFDVLKKLHPGVQWLIHLHSNIAFLSIEGISMGWIRGYVERGLGIIANSEESYHSLLAIVPRNQIAYLPNVYLGDMIEPEFEEYDQKSIDIGCFGAIRPMKNQLVQALAAIQFANERGMYLRFHINGSRIEVGGEPVLKSLRQLFENNTRAELILCKWNEPEEFIEYLYENIDIGMQVSMTETFNVVSADYLTAGVPIVVSRAVKWASRFSQAAKEDVHSIVKVMHRAFRNRWLTLWNQKLLRDHSVVAQRMWFKFIRNGGFHA